MDDCRAVAAVPASSPAYVRRAKPVSHACGVRAGGPGQHQPTEVGQGNMARCHVSHEAAQLRRLNGRGNPSPPMERQSASSVDRQAWRPVATGSPNPAQPMRPWLHRRRTVSMIVPSSRAEERKQDQRAILIHEHACDCRPGHAPFPRSDRAGALSLQGDASGESANASRTFVRCGLSEDASAKIGRMPMFRVKTVAAPPKPDGASRGCPRDRHPTSRIRGSGVSAGRPRISRSVARSASSSGTNTTGSWHCSGSTRR
jgi:hypothetical protein